MWFQKLSPLGTWLGRNHNSSGHHNNHSPTDTEESRYRGLPWRAFTPLRRVSFLESSRHGASSMVSYLVSCGPCRSTRFPSPGWKISNSTSTSTSASGWVCPPASQQLASIPQQECSSSPSRPSQKSSRLEMLGSTWCFGTHRTTSYAKYSLKSELEPSGQLLKQCKKQKPASRSKKSLEPPRPEELV